MKRDPLLWAALSAVLVVLASAEYELAVACGFGRYVAAGVPAALDVYALAALRARQDVLAVVVTLIGVNAASHLVAVGLLPVSVELVVAVSAVAPLVLWRVHRLSETHPEPRPEPSSAEPEPAAELAEPITVERAVQPADAAPVGPVLGPWTTLPELAAGTGGTGAEQSDDRWPGIAAVMGWPNPDPQPEPVPEPSAALVPPTAGGAEDLDTSDSQNTTFEARVTTVRNWLTAEPELTGTEIGTRFGVSDGYGRRLLRTARDDS